MMKLYTPQRANLKQEADQEGKMRESNGGREQMNVELIALHCTVDTAGMDRDRGQRQNKVKAII